MAINYASKYSNVVDERFTVGAVTNNAVNNEYDWTDVNTVKVYSIPTAPMSDYTMSGSNRYGTPGELQDTVQTMILTRDRSFTFTIDRRNFEDTAMTKEAGKALRRQIDEVVIPEIDAYRLGVLVDEAGTKVTKLVDKSNAYEAFLEATATLSNNKVPQTGRIAYVTPKFYKMIKLDDSFIKASDLAQNMLISGQVGQIDNVAIIMVPESYFPEDVLFIITHPSAMVSPVKLSDYRIHENPPGISGWLVEGRIYYDAFVLENKKNAVYVHIQGEDGDNGGNGGNGGNGEDDVE